MELGVIFGFLGFVTAVLSAIYSRSQAREARRQAEAAHASAMVELSRSLNEQMLQSRATLIANDSLVREYLDANPHIAEICPDPDALRAFIAVRGVIDTLQDMYFLRKSGVASSHQWRHWTTPLVPLARMPTFRVAFENAERGAAIDPEFAAWTRPLLDGKAPPTLTLLAAIPGCASRSSSQPPIQPGESTRRTVARVSRRSHSTRTRSGTS
jgi:hypothetical protein